LAASTVNLHLSALRKLASEAADNGCLAPALAAGIARIRGAKRQGVRAGNWLTAEEATRLLNAPDRSTLIGCGNRGIAASTAINGRQALVLYRKHSGEMMPDCKQNFPRRSVFDTAT